MNQISMIECANWLNARGLTLSPRNYPLCQNAEALEFLVPQESGRATALAYLFGDLEKERFEGGLVVFREWNIGSPGLDRIGHSVVSFILKNRSADQIDPNRPLAIVVDSSESDLIPSLLLQGMIFGWDVYYVSNTAEDVVFISHDEIAYLISSRTSFVTDINIQLEQHGARRVPIPYYLDRSLDSTEVST